MNINLDHSTRLVDINGKMGVHIYNSDGSEAAISGNGVCIFAKYLLDHEYVKEKKLKIETLSGAVEVECLNSRATEFRVNMGKASFLSREIPVTGEIREVINEEFTFNHEAYKASCLTIGNPHCIIYGSGKCKTGKRTWTICGKRRRISGEDEPSDLPQD